MAYFSKAFPKIFIGSGALKVTGHPKDLAAGQIALVNSSSNAILASGSTKSDAPMAYLAIGSYHSKDKISPMHGGYKESDKTKGINPNYVSKWWVSSPTAAQNHILQLGWDGVTDCTVPSFTKDKQYCFRVEVKGSPVFRTMKRNFYKTYCVWTGCTEDVDAAADRKAVFENIANQINTDPIMKSFVKAYAGHEDAGTVGDMTGEVAYNVYTLSVSDAGDEVALAAIQTTYPTLTITRLSYTGVTSVYQTIKTSSAPANYGSTAWADAGYDLYKLPRTLCITLPATDTTDGSDDVDAVEAAYSSMPNYVASSADVHQIDSVDALGNCNVVIQIQQYSKNFLELGCDYRTMAEYDDVPAYHGHAWDVCPCDTEDEDTTGKYFLRLEGAYTDTTFSNCSFHPDELFEMAPVEIQADLVDETGDICEFTGLALTTIQQPKQATGTGEELIRDYITYLAYKQDPFSCDPRMREVFDDTVLTAVKRNKQYKKYFLLHNVPRFSNPTSTFDNDQYLVIIAFESGVSTTAFQTLLGTYVTSGVNGVALETK